jgi:hypothetical protein
VDLFIKRYFGKSLRKEVTLRTHNIIAKPALQYDSEPWELRDEDKKRIETSQMRFLRPPLDVSLRDKITSTDIREQLGTGRMVEGIQEYQRKWHNRRESIPLGSLPWKACVYHPTGRRHI